MGDIHITEELPIESIGKLCTVLYESTTQEELMYTDILLVNRPSELNYTVLDKFHFIDEKSKGLQSYKFVNDFNLNYKVNSIFELSLSWN